MRVPEIKLWAGQPDDGGEVTREFLIADVFTHTPLEGNQLGIFPDGRGLSTALMQQVTREMNFSETVFFLPPADDGPEADAHVRIFTPGGELPFAGHPTLGSAWVLSEILGKDTLTLQLGIGLVPVELERDSAGEITFGQMSQPVPAIAPYDRAPELLEALGIEAYGLPVEVYDNGPLHVYAEVASEAALAAVTPDMQALARLKVGTGVFAQITGGSAAGGRAAGGRAAGGRAASGWAYRNFVPYAGIPEDPATGSAAGPLAVHLARYGRIAFGEEIEIRQGAQVSRPSVLYARADGSPDAVERVLVGGRAVVVAHGQYRLR